MGSNDGLNNDEKEQLFPGFKKALSEVGKPMLQSFYQHCREVKDTHNAFNVVMGEGTEYEAVARILCFDGDWDGFIVFKDTRFSPQDDGGLPTQFKHQTPGAGNGVVAEARARMTWKTLVEIFESLKSK